MPYKQNTPTGTGQCENCGLTSKKKYMKSKNGKLYCNDKCLFEKETKNKLQKQK